MKRQVARTFFDTRYISHVCRVWCMEDRSSTKHLFTLCDIAMETLLLAVQPKKWKNLQDLKLNPTYSYARIYKMGDILKRHKDRFSCEISTTMNLGDDPFSIYEAKENVGIAEFEWWKKRC